MAKRIFSKAIKEEAVKLATAEKLLDCCRKTLYRLIKEGKLKAFRVKGKGPYKVNLSEVEKLKQVIVRENVTFPKQTSAIVRDCPQNFKVKNKGVEKR